LSPGARDVDRNSQEMGNRAPRDEEPEVLVEDCSPESSDSISNCDSDKEEQVDIEKDCSTEPDEDAENTHLNPAIALEQQHDWNSKEWTLVIRDRKAKREARRKQAKRVRFPDRRVLHTTRDEPILANTPHVVAEPIPLTSCVEEDARVREPVISSSQAEPTEPLRFGTIDDAPERSMESLNNAVDMNIQVNDTQSRFEPVESRNDAQGIHHSIEFLNDTQSIDDSVETLHDGPSIQDSMESVNDTHGMHHSVEFANYAQDIQDSVESGNGAPGSIYCEQRQWGHSIPPSMPVFRGVLQPALTPVALHMSLRISEASEELSLIAARISQLSASLAQQAPYPAFHHLVS
jgi:hypothetical protein